MRSTLNASATIPNHILSLSTDLRSVALYSTRYFMTQSIRKITIWYFNFITLMHEKRLTNFQVRYDVRGHGRSGKPDSIKGYTPQLYADDFLTVSRAFDLVKPIYVGWLVSIPNSSSHFLID